jgi:hypothetical protein
MYYSETEAENKRQGEYVNPCTNEHAVGLCCFVCSGSKIICRFTNF